MNPEKIQCVGDGCNGFPRRKRRGSRMSHSFTQRPSQEPTVRSMMSFDLALPFFVYFINARYGVGEL